MTDEEKAKSEAFHKELKGYLESYISEASLEQEASELLEMFIEWTSIDARDYKEITRGMAGAEFCSQYYDYTWDADKRASKKQKKFSMMTIKGFLQYLKEVYDLEVDKPLAHLMKRLKK